MVQQHPAPPAPAQAGAVVGQLEEARPAPLARLQASGTAGGTAGAGAGDLATAAAQAGAQAEGAACQAGQPAVRAVQDRAGTAAGQLVQPRAARQRQQLGRQALLQRQPIDAAVWLRRRARRHRHLLQLLAGGVGGRGAGGRQLARGPPRAGARRQHQSGVKDQVFLAVGLPQLRALRGACAHGDRSRASAGAARPGRGVCHAMPAAQHGRRPHRCTGSAAAARSTAGRQDPQPLPAACGAGAALPPSRRPARRPGEAAPRRSPPAGPALRRARPRCLH